MIDREKVISNLKVLWTWATCQAIEPKDNPKIAQWVDATIALLSELDVTPEELERLKLCRHECKIDCLLDQYNKVVEERDTLLMKREALDTETEEAQQHLRNIWDYATVNEIGWMQTAASDVDVAFHLMAGEIFRLKQPEVMSKQDVCIAVLGCRPVFIETRDNEDKEPGDDRWAMLTPHGGILTSGEYLAMSTYITNEMLLFADYNKTWRCWDKKPTDEQRKMVSWDG